MASISQPQSRKQSFLQNMTSEQEMFYKTRSLFKRNKNLIKRISSQERTNQTFQSQPNSPRKYEQMTDKNKTYFDDQQVSEAQNQEFNSTNDTSFGKFFTSSACKFEAMRENDFFKSRERFLNQRERVLSQENAANVVSQFTEDQAWKNLYPRNPKYDFTKLTQRSQLFKGNETDDEIRFNNFSFLQLKEKKFLNLQKKTWRNYQVFNCPLVDELYDNSYKSHQTNVFNKTAMNCRFDQNKQKIEERSFYFQPHSSQIPTNQLNHNQIMRAKDFFNRYKKNNIVNLNNISGRERPGTSHYRFLKNNENIYEHMEKNHQAIKKRKPNQIL